MPILRLSCITLNFIYKRNPLSLNLIPLKYLMDGSLTLVIPTSLILLFNTYILPFIYLIISLNCPIVTIYKFSILSSSTILVSLSHEVDTFIINATGALRGMALLILYYDFGSECVMEPCA